VETSAVVRSEAPSGADRQVKVRIEGVTKQFPPTRRGAVGTTALEAVDIDVLDGEFVSLLGPSGCGKSTLLRIVGGLIQPTQGEVRIGRSNTATPVCSTVFQEYSIFPWLTVENNVRFGLHESTRSKDDDDALVSRWIDRVGLTKFSDAYPGQLSGGMKQRVALARALVAEPEVLLMDEPFAALDAQLRRVLQRELLEITSEINSTVIFVTHSIEEAILLSDRVLIMSARPGRLRSEVVIELGGERVDRERNSPGFLDFDRLIWSCLKDEMEKVDER
jgi:NitT/TauT family transport system ATP-binding protein